MDPITLILQAIAANIAADTITESAKKTYYKLRGLILNKFSQNSNKETAQFAEKMLSKYETDPKVYKEPFRKELETVDAGDDTNILETALMLLKELGISQEETKMIQKIINKSKVDNQTFIQQANKVKIGSDKKSK